MFQSPRVNRWGQRDSTRHGLERNESDEEDYGRYEYLHLSYEILSSRTLTQND